MRAVASQLRDSSSKSAFPDAKFRFNELSNESVVPRCQCSKLQQLGPRVDMGQLIPGHRWEPHYRDLQDIPHTPHPAPRTSRVITHRGFIDPPTSVFSQRNGWSLYMVNISIKNLACHRLGNPLRTNLYRTPTRSCTSYKKVLEPAELQVYSSVLTR